MSIELMKRKNAAGDAMSKTRALWLARDTRGRNWSEANYGETLAELHFRSYNPVAEWPVKTAMIATLGGIAFLFSLSLL